MNWLKQLISSINLIFNPRPDPIIDKSFPIGFNLSVQQCREFQKKFQQEFTLVDKQFEYLESCSDEFRLYSAAEPVIVETLKDWFGPENYRKSKVTGNHLFRPKLRKYPEWYRKI